jgi:pimeloyl-ACP methyl ester carboxylesterase
MNGDGVELAVEVAGDGPAVLLLHGFPDSGRLWRDQVPSLTDAGLRAIVPDLRGFGASEAPAAVEDYRIGRSVADMVAVLDQLGVERARVVGHDWGAAVAWAMALLAPDRVERLAVLSVGHPATRALREIEDREKAWYMLLFQFAEAEEILAKDDWALARQWTASHPDAEDVLADLQRPGRLTAGLNWYRANLHPRTELAPARQLPPVKVPVLGLWSDGDRYLLEHGMTRSERFVAGPWRYERIEGASHWMQRDATQRVNQLLGEFLA